MKAFRILKRSIRDSIKSVFRNFSLSLASISCITITLLVVAISIVLSYNLNNFTNIIEKNVTIVVFLNMDVDQDKVNSIQEDIKNIDYVDKKSPNSPLLKNCFNAFWVGGLICTIGQIIYDYFMLSIKK